MTREQGGPGRSITLKNTRRFPSDTVSQLVERNRSSITPSKLYDHVNYIRIETVDVYVLALAAVYSREKGSDPHSFSHTQFPLRLLPDTSWATTFKAICSS